MDHIRVEYIYLDKIGMENDFIDSKKVAEIRLIVDRRDVEHDGYCSDPGEDTGEWKYDLNERYLVNKHILEKLQPYINVDNTVDITILKKLFESDELGCQCGSNYCGYEGARIVKKGWIVYKEELEKEELYNLAKYEVEKYGGTTEEHLPRIIERKKRQELLLKAMMDKGLSRQSKQGIKWIDTGFPELEKVINDMIELKWCFEYHKMNEKLNKLSNKQQLTEPKIFNQVKEEILRSNPVPDVLPWLKK